MDGHSLSRVDSHRAPAFAAPDAHGARPVCVLFGFSLGVFSRAFVSGCRETRPASHWEGRCAALPPSRASTKTSAYTRVMHRVLMLAGCPPRKWMACPVLRRRSRRRCTSRTPRRGARRQRRSPGVRRHHPAVRRTGPRPTRAPCCPSRVWRDGRDAWRNPDYPAAFCPWIPAPPRSAPRPFSSPMSSTARERRSGHARRFPQTAPPSLVVTFVTQRSRRWRRAARRVSNSAFERARGEELLGAREVALARGLRAE